MSRTLTQVLKNFLFFISSLFLFFLFLRVILLLANPPWYVHRPWEDLLNIFLVGTRFDLAVCAWFALLLNLFWVFIFLFRSKVIFSVLALCLRVLVVVLILFSFVDNLFIPYTGMRFDPKSINFSTHDLQTQIFQLIGQYWTYLILFLFVVFSLLFVLESFLREIKKVAESRTIITFKEIRLNILLFFSILGISIVCIRGGLQVKPLSSTHAYSLGSSHDAVMALNSVYVFLNSFNREEMPAPSGFLNVDIAQKVLDGVASGNAVEVDNNRQGVLEGSNVIVFILESFSCEFSKACSKLEEGFTPFLDSISLKGVSFEYAFANGRRSIDAVSSIFSSLPSLMNQPVIRSRFIQSKLFSLPKVFRENQYTTYFFHGGMNGTMFFDVFAKLLGFDFYYGFEEYPYKEDYDGSWGAFDEPYLQYVGQKLRQESRSFFASIFTLSSHNPYRVPDHFKFDSSQSVRPIQKSVAYADWSLKKFFETYQNDNWFKNTLFVFTADHTSELRTNKFNNTLGVYRVPIVFWHPSFDLKKISRASMAQHVDIGPSILDLLFSHDIKSRSRFGRSLFNPSIPDFVYNGDQNFFWFMKEPSVFYEWTKGDELKQKKLSFDINKQSSEFSDMDNVQFDAKKKAQALQYIYQYSYWHGNIIEIGS